MSAHMAGNGRPAAALVMAAAITAATSIMSAASAPVRLVGVSAQGNAVLIEASEPVAYSVSRPDPLTVVLDLRNVSAADARTDVRRQGAIAGVTVEQTKAVDGREVARVRVRLAQMADYKVRSARNLIRVELSPEAGSAARVPAVPAAPAAEEGTAPAPPAAGAASTTPATVIERVSSRRLGSATVVTLSGDGHLAPTRVAESEDAPRRLVLDFTNVQSTAPVQTEIGSTLIRRVRIGLNSSQPVITRVVMEIDRAASYRVERAGEAGRDLSVVFDQGRADTVMLAPADAPAAVTPVPAMPDGAPSSTQAPIVPATQPPDPMTALNLLPPPVETNASVPAGARKTPSPAAKAGPIEPPNNGRGEPMPSVPPLVERNTSAPAVVRTAPPPPAVMADPVEASRTEPGRPMPLVAPPIERSRSTQAPARNPSPAAPVPKPAEPEAPDVPAQAPASAPAAPRAQTAAAPAPRTQSGRPAQTQTQTQPTAPAPQISGDAPQIGTSQGQKTYTGHPISLDFTGGDLRTVLRLFAEVSGLNMIIDPDVQGSVDIVLNDVPWDQALEVILRGNQLDYTVDGTIVRIARIETLKREQDARQALAKSAADAGTLAVRTFPLSYARAVQAAPLVRKAALSPRGDVQIDERTNMLIITDLPARLETAATLLSALDKPEPQVEIEARIVSTSRDFSRAVGIQWGLNGRVSPQLGNTTGLAFPNSGSLGGRLGTQGAQGSDPRANPNDQTGTVVNLPSTLPAAAAIGLAMGSVNGAFNLDVALSALESSGKVRILSTPRVTTQNNVKAEMTQGVQIPVQTQANNTVTVTFKDAALTLRVTPQITAANTVIMQVELENASPGEEVQGIPSILTQRALTTVQVNDGATTIIGGVLINEERQLQDRVPALHRVPLLGWLFKRNTNIDDSRELLIFITPRILKG